MTNSWCHVDPITNQYEAPSSYDAANNTAVSPSRPFIPVSPYLRDALSHSQEGSPDVSPGPLSTTHPSPTFSYSSSSSLYQSLPSVSCSLSSFRPMTQPSPLLSSLPPKCPSSKRDSSIRFKQNRSALPPRVPVTKSNSLTYDEETMKNSHAAKGDESMFMTGPKGVKRSRQGKESVSVDSDSGGLMKPPPSPGNKNATNLNSGNAQSSSSELKEISVRTIQVAISDPKEVKRIIANRKSAARSKERKMRYLADLEHRLKTLKMDNKSLSDKLALLEKEKLKIMNEKMQLSIQIESMKEEARFQNEMEELKLATALYEQGIGEGERMKVATDLIKQLNAEVQRLKVATGEATQNHGQFDIPNMHSLDPNMFQQFNMNQVNQFNQPQPNPEFYGQPNPNFYWQPNPEFYVQPNPDFYEQAPNPDFYEQV